MRLYQVGGWFGGWMDFGGVTARRRPRHRRDSLLQAVPGPASSAASTRDWPHPAVRPRVSPPPQFNHRTFVSISRTGSGAGLGGAGPGGGARLFMGGSGPLMVINL